MKTVNGVKVYTNLAEVVASEHTALLIIDVQEGDWKNLKGMTKKALAGIERVLEAARTTGVRVIYFRNVQPPDHLTMSPPYLRLLIKGGYRPGKDPIPVLEGSPDTNILSCIAPKSGERVIDKRRGSAFEGTELDVILRSNRIETIVLVGGSTDWCVEATLWAATGRDYYAVVLEDCVRSPRPAGHRAALKQMAVIADVARAADVIAIWNKKKKKL
ncbi:MAG: cysteine hydrolase [Phycisphaerae bacterium]|nr:cysteine hydrolase [Phycisphaerae bacterium]